MSALREMAHFVRWRLVPVRYAGKLRRLPAVAGRPVRDTRLPEAQTVLRQGYCSGPAIEAQQLQRIQATFQPRIASVVPKPSSHPFENLFTAADIAPENDVFRLAFSPQVLGVADDYFGGRLWLDSIQVLYSWPTTSLHESQMWHKDYGDNKTFHWIAYLNDVRQPEDGPFVFVDKIRTRRIRRSPLIRRIDDATFTQELGDDGVTSFTGAAGSSVYVDPSVCYHYGSRCRNGRLAIFVTFNTDAPFVDPTPLVVASRERILQAAQVVRPDLGEDYLRRLLQLR